MISTRPITPEDETFVSDWLERDETHRLLGLKWKDVIAPNTHAEIVTDEDGTIITVIRYHLALRAAMQFNPDTPYRVAKHGTELRERLVEHAKEIGALEVVIRPGNKAVRFSEKLGFYDFSGSKIIGV